jgi:hypothetical protein
VLDPISTYGLTKDDVLDLTERTRAVIADALTAMRSERGLSAAGSIED